MNIESIELRQLNMPLKTPFETSFGKTTMRDFILASVHGGGETGYAESVAMSEPTYNEETTGTVWHMLEDYLIPTLLKAQVSAPEEVSDLFSFVRRNNMAKAALEGAVWDLYCKQQHVSLASALGGTKTEIDVGVSIGIEPTIEALLARVEAYLADGYKKIKVKIKPGWDKQPLAAIRQHFGEDVPLMADANSAYSLRDIHTLKELDQFQLLMIEQPLAHDDMLDHAKLQQEIETPVCLDESISSAEDARKAIELKSCQVINIKIGRVGGLLEAKKIHDLCQQYRIPVWCGGMLESGVGRAHNIAITALDNFTIPGDTSAASRYWEEDIVEPPVELLNPGTLAVPDRPGIGFAVNEQVLDKYTVRHQRYMPEA